MEKQYKYAITQIVTANNKNVKNGYFESGEDFLGIYDTLEEAQEGIRKEWKWQEEHSKDDWKKNNITYELFNFTFDTVPDKLKGNKVAEGLKDRQAIVKFKTDDVNKVFDWTYSIRQIPYKPF